MAVGRKRLFLLLVCGVIFVACKAESVIDIVNNTPELSKMKRFVTGSYSRTLQDTTGRSKITVFLPHNDAFDEKYTPRGWYNELLSTGKKDKVEKALQYSTLVHPDKTYNRAVLNQEAGSKGWLALATHLASDTNLFYSNIQPGFINGAKMVGAEKPASNGVVHIINRFLYDVGQPHSAGTHIMGPSWGSSDRLFRDTVTIYHDQKDHEGNIDAHYAISHSAYVTLFYPTDDALEALEKPWRQITVEKNKVLRKELVESHVVTGQVLHTGFVRNRLENRYQSFYGQGNQGKNQVQFKEFNNELYVTSGCTQAKLVRANITVSNGVIHVINGVLGLKQDNIMDMIDGDDELTKFDSHMGTSELKTQLSDGTSNTQFTVFAPVDSAWGDLDLTQSTTRLLEVMRMHVISGEVLDIASLTSQPSSKLTMQSGVRATFTTSSDKKNVYVEVNGIRARILMEGSMCAQNGIVYKVDQVLGTAAHSALDYLQNTKDDNDDGIFDEFYNKLVAFELDDILKGEATDTNQKVTVFAPTDEAFEAMRATPRGEELLNMKSSALKSQLRNIMNRHIIREQVIALNSSLQYPYLIDTGRYGNIEIFKKRGKDEYFIGDTYFINITLPNQGLTNGVLHFVDGVMYHDDPALDASTSSSAIWRITKWLLPASFLAVNIRLLLL